MITVHSMLRIKERTEFKKVILSFKLIFFNYVNSVTVNLEPTETCAIMEENEMSA